MKKLCTIAHGGHLATKSSLALLLSVTLGLAFWTATTPVAKARDMSPTEMIQAELPAGVTIASATKPQLLRAVCAAVRKHPAHAPQIARVAVNAHKPWTVDILRKVMQCLGHEDCGLLNRIVVVLQEETPEEAAALHDVFVQFAPNCVGGGGGEEGNFNNPPSNINPPPGSAGAGAGRNLCLVCHNGHDLRIPCDQVAQFLRNHPGDFAGSCRPTPVTNQ